MEKTSLNPKGLATGYFATVKKGSKVHVIFNNSKKTICNRIFPKSEFQWCSNGIAFNYIDCEHCKKLAMEYYASINPKPVIITKNEQNRQSLGILLRKHLKNDGFDEFVTDNSGFFRTLVDAMESAYNLKNNT